MYTFSSANSLSVSVRIYRTLLVAYPQKFRDHYETQMVQVFRDSIREAYHHHGIPGVVELWLHTLFDLVFTALIERISERSRFMFSPKVVWWGGVAAVFSGLFWLMTGISPTSGAATLELALILGLGGLASLYSRQAGEGGKLGLTGFALGVVGTTVALVASWWEYSVIYSGGSNATVNLRIERELATAAQSVLGDTLAFLILGIGLALLGVASLRAKTPLRWRGVPLTLGLLYILLSISFWFIFYIPLSHGQSPWHPWTPSAYLPAFALFVLIGIGWIALGATLALEAVAEVAPTPSTSA